MFSVLIRVLYLCISSMSISKFSWGNVFHFLFFKHIPFICFLPSCLAACFIRLRLKKTYTGCSSEVTDSLSLLCVRFYDLHTHNVIIHVTYNMIIHVWHAPRPTGQSRSHSLSNASSCFLMRGDDLVIYDAGLGSEQTTLHTAVGMPLSKAIISQLPSRSARFPTVKSRSQVYRALKATARVWCRTLPSRSKCHLSSTWPPVRCY